MMPVPSFVRSREGCNSLSSKKPPAPGKPQTIGKPQGLGDVLGELFARRGYGRVNALATYTEAWQTAAGDRFRAMTRVTGIRRGVFEVAVANSTLVQELVFEKVRLKQELARALPDEKIVDVRFRVGAVR